MNWTDCLAIRERENAPLHPNVPANDFHNSVLISPRHHYVYTNNPKTACTTIRKLLIDAEFGEVRPFTDRAATIYFKEFLPFNNVWQLGNFPQWLQKRQPFTFCFVRNPYTRLLSGYLDKIVRNKAEKQSILEAMGKADQPDYPVSFAEFVRTVCALPIDKQDHHWRVQYYQTFQEGIDYNFVGRFERLEADLRTLARHLGITDFITPETFGNAGEHSRKHATNAEAQIREYYTQDLCELVRHKYEKDFAYFGYSTDLP